MLYINDLYSGCKTREEFEETRQRINLWMMCDLDPKTAGEWLRRNAQI